MLPPLPFCSAAVDIELALSKITNFSAIMPIEPPSPDAVLATIFPAVSKLRVEVIILISPASAKP